MTLNVAYEVHEREGLPEDAPVVVLSNSLGATRSMWDQNIDALAEHFKIVRYDTRGHGQSPLLDGPYEIADLTADVVALLDHLELDRVHFVGLSLGGMVGMDLAARYPERVHNLVVLCTAAHLEPQQAWHDRAALVRAEGTEAVAEAVVGRWYTASLHEREPERIKDAVGIVAATSTEGYAGCCEAIATMDLRPLLPQIAAPTLAIAGAEDPATPPAKLEEIADAVQTGTAVTVESSSHLANDEQPQIVNELLLNHLLDK